MSFLLNPFAFAGAAAGAFESIATVTVGAGGASSIEFTSIPATYQHLQVRMMLRNSGGGTLAPTRIRINGDTNTANYTLHDLTGNGSITYAQGATGLNYIAFGETSAGALANTFCASVLDILDYTNTSKTTTLRSFSGADLNGSGAVAIHSKLWTNTAAVTSFALVPWAGTYVQNCTAALYGIKA